MTQEVVIVDRNGTEHRFPSGFDPKRAAEIVRSQLGALAPVSPTAAPKQPSKVESGFATLGDVIIGALKGGGETAINLGAMLHKIPGVSEVVDKLYGDEGSDRWFDAAKQTYTQPTNTAQSIGRGAERVAETLIPAGKVLKASKGAAGLVQSLFSTGSRAASVLPTVTRMGIEGAGGAAISAAQGGDATVGGVLSAGVPLVGRAVAAIPSSLKAQAGKQVMQALGATKERYKAMSGKITPDVLRRGLTGSRESLKARADEMASQVGKQIDDAIQTYGSRPVNTQPVVDALESSKDAFRTTTQRPLSDVLAENLRRAKLHHGPAPIQILSQPTAQGIVDVAVNIEPRALQQLDSLQQTIREIGSDARVDQLIAVRRAWDKIVSQAGGYQQRAGGAIGTPLADQSEAAVKREGATAIRKLLDAEVPELSAINKEYSFWKSLDDVLTQTLQRTQPQSEGLGRKIAQGVGASVGGFASSGGGPMAVIGGAGLGAAAVKMLDKAITSPRWALTSAKLKDRLADAMASGKPARIIDALGQITAVQSSKVGR